MPGFAIVLYFLSVVNVALSALNLWFFTLHQGLVVNLFMGVVCLFVAAFTAGNAYVISKMRF